MQSIAKTKFFLFLALVWGLLLPAGVAQAQNGVPLSLPLFLNDDAFCQSEDVVDDSYTITCGRMTDDTPFGDPDFPDCVNITERRPTDGPSQLIDTDQASYLQNTNLHDGSACPKNQMDPAQTLQVTRMGSGTATFDQTFGSVSNADFNGANFNDFAYPRLAQNSPEPGLEEWLSNPLGGFDLLGNITSADASSYPRFLTTEPGNLNYQSFRTDPFEKGNFVTRCVPAPGSTACPSEKNALCFDCNQDDLPDFTQVNVVGTIQTPLLQISLSLISSLNQNGDLQGPNSIPAVATVNSLITPLSATREVVSAIANEDFNNDGLPDVAVVVGHRGGTLSDTLYICSNDPAGGACNFNCVNALDLSTVVTDADYSPSGTGADPFSVAAGDFNGDGENDLAISFIGEDTAGALLSRIAYLFGDGTGAFSAGASLQASTAFTSVGGSTALLTVGGEEQTDVVPTSLAVGHYDNDGILDLAVTNFHNSPGNPQGPSSRFTVAHPQGFVLALRSDGTSGAAFSPTAVPLQFPVQDLELIDAVGNFIPIQAPYDRASGIASTDFDHCGGDDIIVLAESCPPGLIDNASNTDQEYGQCVNPNVADGFFGQREAVVFLNANEAPVVAIGPGEPVDFPSGQDLNIPASCFDPSNDHRTFQWNVLSAPAGANVAFGTPNGTLQGMDTNASSTLNVDTLGGYTIELSCTDFCNLTSTVP